MVEVATKVTTMINRPREAVAGYMSDPVHDVEWIGGVTTARVVTDGPVGVGTHVERVARFLGRRIEYVNEIVAIGPDRLDMRSVKAPFPMSVTYQYTPSGDGTEVTIDARGDVGRFFGVMRPLVARMLRRNISKDLATLKRRLEADG